MTPTSRPKVKPMLASTEKPDLATIRYPKLASVKLDGIRCYIDFDGPKVRSGEPVPNDYMRGLLMGLPVGLDGELVCLVEGDGREEGCVDFRATTGNVRRKTGEPAFEYRVFDLWPTSCLSLPFRERYSTLQTFIASPTMNLWPWLKLVKHFEVANPVEVDAAFRGAIAAGEEGLILRDPQGLYKMGRATLKSEAMLKVKPYELAEGVIVGVTERMHSTAEKTRGALGQAKRSKAKEFREGTGLVGAFVCCTLEDFEKVKSMKGVPMSGADKVAAGVSTFEVAAGKMSHEESRRIFDHWLMCPQDVLGRIIRYQHLTVGGYDSVRSGTFQGFREKWDMGE